MNVYLDNAASTCMHPEVLQAMTTSFHECHANPSSPHQVAGLAREAMDDAREAVARAINGDAGEIVFTSGASESNHLGIVGAAALAPPERRHLIVSAIEHPSVLGAIAHLGERGFSVTVLPPGRDGLVSVEAVAAAIRPETFLCSLMMANNELGTIQPIESVGALLREKGIVFHCDAVQAVGKIPVDVRRLGVDLLSLSAHKMHGPKGVGALFIRRGLRLKALIGGGSQERGLRPGTENVPGIVGLGKAIEIATAGIESKHARARALRARFEAAVLSQLEGAALTVDHPMRSPYISNILFSGVDNNFLLRSLDANGIYVTSGSACAAHSLAPSHVLMAIGLTESQARSAVRFSISSLTTEQEIDYAVAHLVRLINPRSAAQVAMDIL